MCGVCAIPALSFRPRRGTPFPSPRQGPPLSLPGRLGPTLQGLHPFNRRVAVLKLGDPNSLSVFLEVGSLGTFWFLASLNSGSLVLARASRCARCPPPLALTPGFLLWKWQKSCLRSAVSIPLSLQARLLLLWELLFPMAGLVTTGGHGPGLPCPALWWGTLG